MAHSKKKYSVHEVVSILESGEFDEAEIFITPPDDDGADSAEDSGDEDTGGSVNNLSGKQLRVDADFTGYRHGQKVYGSRSEGDDAPPEATDAEEVQPSSSTVTTSSYSLRKQAKSARQKWYKKDLPSTEQKKFERNSTTLQITENDWAPHLWFEQFFDEEVIQYLCDQSKFYASFKGKLNFTVSPDEIRAFLAVLLISGYAVVPRRRMMWEQSEDVCNVAVSQLMKRDRFEEILRYLHLADNSRLPVGDKLGKIRPFYEMMNERFLKAFQIEQNLCIDEAMIPYYGKHSAKQFMKSKPIKFGYKLWCVNTHLGYLIQCKPYAGKGVTLPELGLGGSVVTGLISILPKKVTFQLTFDNLFTSLPLLQYLGDKGIGATGTLTANRVQDCPVLDTKSMSKSPRKCKLPLQFYQSCDSNTME
ncbi:UNVERIFIED_CONTAM: hypothetical protein FKN15_033832 [Acipenser sinensis]